MTTIIVKVTERCNSNCAYCDVVRKPGTGGTMPLSVFDTLCCRIDEYLRSHPDERLDFIWHGGEPLTLSPE